MEITEEQRKRSEANRIAALAKRKATEAIKGDAWKLFKCRKVSSEPDPLQKLAKPSNSLPERFRVRLEICSPDSFCVTPEPLPGLDSLYPGEKECLKKLSSWLSYVVPSHYTQNQGGGAACVYKLRDYDIVLKCLKKFKDIELQEIPWRTLTVIQKFSHSFCVERWIPCMPDHLSDENVDVLLKKLPHFLFDALLPFQHEGVRFGLRRGGSCLIADEMGLGKTIQAIAIACCFMNEGPILVVCPAILRFSWAEELERWLPLVSPLDIHLVFGHQDNPSHLTRWPRVVVISYTMLHRLRKSMLEQEWALLIVDESQHVRSTKKPSEPEEIQAVLDVAAKVKRRVLLSGTPSLSRPFDIFHQINILWSGLLGNSKYEFAKDYCAVKLNRGYQGKTFQDFSKGVRLEELNVLLTQTVMVRRLKEHVMLQLPPKRRQVIRLVLKRSEIIVAVASAMAVTNKFTKSGQEIGPVMNDATCEIDANSDNTERHRNPRQLSFQELGIAKLSGFREWLSIHPIIAEREHPGSMNMNLKTHKMLVFAHHLKVLDGVQEFLCEKEIGFVRIDGNTLARDRQSAVQTFRSSPEIKIAIIGITAGGVGIDFSSAQNVVFLEMPQSTSEMQQAEDRAHRRGQTNAVNIYIFCAKDTTDESRWHNLNKSLHRVSSMMNGKYDAIQEITVERVSDLCFEGYVSECQVSEENDTKDPKSKASSANPVNVTDSTGNESALAGIASCNELSEIEISNAKSSDVNIGMETVEEVPDTDGSDEHAQADSISLSQADYLHLGDSVPRYASVILRIGTPDRIITTKLNEASKTVSAASKGDESVPVDLIVSDSDSLISADSLRFEVSQYTGRVHLYTCIPGKDTRPKPLFENFRPEELQLTHVSDENTNKQTDRKCIKKSPAYKHILLEFVKQWNNLRPIEQKKLFGKPLQLPLGLELCYLQESINHGAGGLLKGGSKRRATPLHEIIYALPENAEWKTISLSTGNQKKGRQYTQAWSMSGEPLCKLCQKQCEGKLAKIPQFFEDLFCNLACFEEYRTRTSGRWLREELFKIEHGVCTMCNLDCHKLVCSIKPLSAAKRREYIERVAPNVASRKKLLSRLVSEAIEGNAWHADHIVPVSEGGGECNLDNIRTLCVACHYKVTAALCNDTRVRRNKAKKQLKAIMRGLKDDFYTKQSTSDLKEGENLKIGENPIEDELVIRVPGSAYTASSSKVPAESEEQYAS